MGFRIVNLFGRTMHVRKWMIDIPIIINDTYFLSNYKISNICITDKNVNDFIKNEYDSHKKNNIILNPVTYLNLDNLNFMNYFLNKSNIIYHQPINVLVHDEKIDPFVFNLFCKKNNFSYGLYNEDDYVVKQTKISKLINEKHI